MAGGHFAVGDTKKVLLESLQWPTLFGDVDKFVKQCDECQRFVITCYKVRISLHPIIQSQPFEKWGIDVFGPISPDAKSTQAYRLLHQMDLSTCTTTQKVETLGISQNSYMKCDH